MEATTFLKEYKYKASLIGASIGMIALFFAMIFMFYKTYEDNTKLVTSGVQLSETTSSVLFCLIGIVCLVLLLIAIYFAYLGQKVERNIVMDSEGITFFTSQLTADKATRMYEEIHSLSESQYKGQVYLTVVFTDQTEFVFCRTFFASRKLYEDFRSNLIRLVEAGRAAMNN